MKKFNLNTKNLKLKREEISSLTKKEMYQVLGGNTKTNPTTDPTASIVHSCQTDLVGCPPPTKLTDLC